jgi:hypothetical protein
MASSMKSIMLGPDFITLPLNPLTDNMLITVIQTEMLQRIILACPLKAGID